MAKNRNKKKRNGAVSMDTCEPSVSQVPQAMDTSESGAQDPVSGAPTITQVNSPGRLIGEVSYKEWQWQITATKEGNPLMIDQSGSAGSFSSDWPCLCLGSYLVDCGQLRGSLSNFFMKAFYLSLESGRFWFPAQLYKSSRLLLQCQNALLTYDSKTNTFQARQQHGSWRFIGKNLGWDMVRAHPVETPPYHLHVSDLHTLKPGHHIEIQFRSNTRTPYDWWYAVIGHLETCDENENHCLCDQSDILVVEFKQYSPRSQMRRVKLWKNNINREQNDGMNRFCGGIRKILSEEEIATWKTLFPQPRPMQVPLSMPIPMPIPMREVVFSMPPTARFPLP